MAFLYKKIIGFFCLLLCFSVDFVFSKHNATRAIRLSRIKEKKSKIIHATQYLFDYDCSLQNCKNSGHVDDTLPLEETQVSSMKHGKDRRVRVLLGECSQDSGIAWKFVSQGGFFVGLVGGSAKHKKKTNLHELQVLVKQGVIYLNGKKIAGDFYISPLAGHAEYDGIAYDGDFFIQKYKNQVMCINSVPLEEYLHAVLRTESWPGWPLEVNKVFAVASRTYVISQALEAKKSKRPYHVKNSNVHQTYKGRHSLQGLKDAVQQTQGLILGFEGLPILAMFDCCCGGIIPAKIDDFNFKQAPYLARNYPCTYCKKCSLYAWTVVYDQHIFEEIVHTACGNSGRISDLFVSKKDKAGLVGEVKIRMAGSHVVVTGKKLYSLFKDVKSYHFAVSKKGKKVIFNGRGFGHHLGLCQWGAREMVKQGKDYVSILQFYYPGTSFMRMS